MDEIKVGKPGRRVSTTGYMLRKRIYILPMLSFGQCVDEVILTVGWLHWSLAVSFTKKHKEGAEQ